MADDFIPLGGANAPGQGGLPSPSQGSAGGSTSSGSSLNSIIDFIRPFASNAAGFGAAALSSPAAALPGGQVVPFLAETQGYAGMDMALKGLKSGQKPSFGEMLGDSEKDAMINAVGGRILNTAARGTIGFVRAIRDVNTPDIYKLFPTTSQALEAYGHHALATAAKIFEDINPFGSKTASLDRSGGEGFAQALAMANSINGHPAQINADPVKLADSIRSELSKGFFSPKPGQNQITQDTLKILEGGEKPFSKIDAVLQDSRRLNEVLNAGAGISSNVRKDLQAYQFMDMFNKAATRDANGAVTRLNPKTINDIWNNPDMNDSLEKLWGNQGRQNVTDFISAINKVQDKPINYLSHRAAWLMTGGFGLGGVIELLSGNIGTAGAGTVGAFITAGTMGKLLTSPKVARSIVAMAGGEPLQMPQRYVGNAIMDALQGTQFALLGRDGTKTWGTVEKNRQSGAWDFIPVK